MSLSDRIRPGVECAPWVYDEVCCLEAERDQLREERDRLKAALSKSKQTAERWRAECIYFWSMS